VITHVSEAEIPELIVASGFKLEAPTSKEIGAFCWSLAHRGNIVHGDKKKI
jgi:hypothetical protein